MSTNSSSDDLVYQLLHSHNDGTNAERGELTRHPNDDAGTDGMNLMSPVSQALYKGYKNDIQQSNDFCHREVQRGLLTIIIDRCDECHSDCIRKYIF